MARLYYTPTQSPTQEVPRGPTETMATADSRAFLVGVGEKMARDDHPAPFHWGRLSLEDEQLVATDDFTKINRILRRNGPDRPVLFTDGPLEFGLTVVALDSYHVGKKKVEWPAIFNNITSDKVKKLQEKAEQTVCELPGEVVGRNITRREWNNSKRRYDEAGGKEGARLLADGSLNRYLDAKIKTVTEQLIWSQHRSQLTLAPVIASYQPLTDRLRQHDGVQAALGNVAALARTRAAFEERVQQLGQERAELSVILGRVYDRLRAERSGYNQRTPENLHGVINHNTADRVAKLRFLWSVARQTSVRDNWTDEDIEMLERIIFGITAHQPFNTVDVVAHGPTSLNTGTVMTLKNVEELLNNPTATWADETQLYIYDGIEMNPELIRQTIQKPSTLMKVINAEQRRVLLRLVGTDALLADVKAELVAQDDFGDLFKLPNGSQFVVVNNATPEPDGSVKKYVLGTIGNAHKTARSGVASTWGLREDQYWPVKET